MTRTSGFSSRARATSSFARVMSAVTVSWKTGASHAAVRRRAIVLRMVVSGTRSISPGTTGGAGGVAACAALDVLGDDPALRTRAGERAQVDPALARDTPRERRSLDAAAVARRLSWLGLGQRGCRGWQRCLAPSVSDTGSAAVASVIASPCSPIQAMVCPTGASPSWSAILSRTPAKSASTSWVTLSVSISKSGSPFSTVSPSDFSHFVTVPDSIPWPRRGSLTSFAIATFPTVRLIAASTSAGAGTTNCSITGANASGANFAPTRSIGASSQSNALYWRTAATSAPKPMRVTASCATTTRFVFFTDATSASSSSGCSVRGSITSTEMPSSSAASAASSERCTSGPVAITVTSVPSRTVRALPSGIGSSSSGTSPFTG